jgi:hypothetical protein
MSMGDRQYYIVWSIVHTLAVVILDVAYTVTALYLVL